MLGNDANLMGLGETMYGAGKGDTHVVFLTVGTGIGGAVVIDGKLFNGFANRGTELGHVPFIANGEPCNCGAVGCLEHYASTSALVRQFAQRAKAAGLSYPDEEINGELIVRPVAKKGIPLLWNRWSNTATIWDMALPDSSISSVPRKLLSEADCRKPEITLHSENKRKDTPLRHGRLRSEYRHHGCGIGQQSRKFRCCLFIFLTL